MSDCIADNLLFQTGLYVGLAVGQQNPERDVDILKFQVIQIIKEYFEENKSLDSLDEFFRDHGV